MGIGLRRWTVATLVVSVVVVGSAHLHTRRLVEEHERRLLAGRAADVSLVASQLISRVETSYVALHTVASATDGDPAAFRRAAQPALGAGVLVSAMLLRPDGTRDAVVGRPALPATPAEPVRARLDRAATTGGLVWVGRFGTGLRQRLGFAYGARGNPGGDVVYAEMLLAAAPLLLPTEILGADSDSGLNGLQVALYTDGSEQPEALLFSRARTVPLEGLRTSIPVTVGSDRWLLVIAPQQPFSAGVVRAGPWVLLGVGLLAAALLAGFVEVTGRRRRDAARTREERFALLVQQFSDVVTVVDPDWKVGYHSPSAERVFGYPPAELGGSRLLDLVHPDDVACLDGRLAAARSEPGRTLVAECRLRHRDGRWLRLEVTGRNLVDEPAVGGVILNWRDVTARFEAEADRALLASIVEATPDLVLTADSAGRIAFLNSAGRQMLGLAPDDDVSDRPLPSLMPDVTSASRFEEALTTVHGGGSWSGELAIRAAGGGELPVLAVMVSHRDHSGAARYTSTIARDISERKQLEEELARRAFTDMLTGLPNRALFRDRLDQAVHRSRRSLEPLAVLFIDLDDFKTINDSLGHAAGDALLVAAAGRLRSCLRGPDTLARLGGDEFAVVIEEAASEVAASLAERIARAFSAPFTVEDREVVTTTSVGVAVLGPLEIDRPEDILRAADTALYAAKNAGKAGHAMYQPSMLAASVERLELRADLARALERDELVLEYQPIVTLDTGRVAGVEALLRWDHPRHGLLPPGRFIALAEETGHIVPIGRWVIRQACRQVVAWQAEHPDLAHLDVSVNVSGRQLVDPDLPGDVAAALHETGMAPERLILEITESVLVQHAPVTDVLLRLKALGVRLAIDDFGTGYSSFGSLQELPVDVLKIDKMFVRALREAGGEPTLLAAILRLGQALGLDIVAEGVEAADQAAGLEELACPRAQGYYFSVPHRPDTVAGLLAHVLPLEVRRPAHQAGG